MSTSMEKVSISAHDGIITTGISLTSDSDQNPEFAFYIFKNYVRIHTEWYSKSSEFVFDTQGQPGCYHVQAFAKISEDNILQGNSSSVFLNPLKVTPESFPNAHQDAVAYSLKGEHWTFPALFYPSETNALYVLMPAAVNRKKSLIPAFNRWTWAKDGVFPGNVLCVSDPTLELHDDLEIGWCLGRKEHCATTELSRFVTRFAEERKIPYENIVIYGSSAGGFAALALSAKIDGSTAVAINPQVDALAYSGKEQVALVSEVCFGVPQDKIKRDYPERVDMKEAWRNKNKSRAFFVQNLEDGHHYDVHFKPMWESLGCEPAQEGVTYSGRHIAWIYRQQGGHIPETKEMASEIVKKLGIS